MESSMTIDFPWDRGEGKGAYLRGLREGWFMELDESINEWQEYVAIHIPLPCPWTYSNRHSGFGKVNPKKRPIQNSR